MELKPVRPFVNRDDYRWFIDRFGDDGVAPAQGELFKRARDHIDELEKEIAEINKVLKENVK